MTTAIDLYSGVGGWALGLRMAGIEPIASYEWWSAATLTHEKNFPGTEVHEVDIRTMDLSSLPKGVDLVVGSPPCTEFSYSNRGGNGDIADGLKDVYRFLEAVEYLSPRYWVMENVPRVDRILRQEHKRRRGRCRELLDQILDVDVLDMSEFGLPQGRRRTFAGNFRLDLLRSYRAALAHRTLGDILEALRGDPVEDPLYGTTLPRGEVTEMDTEDLLDEEEVRMNREAKEYHPVYNVMSFPDETDRPSRTVTALCTRVSRESIVIRDPELGGYRRLTLRERASLQGFPTTFQFFGQNYTEKVKMIGNALPPLMAYYVAHSMLGTAADSIRPPDAGAAYVHETPEDAPPATPPDRPAKRYPWNRSFRAAIPHLRFKSGMRFDLSNEFEDEEVAWVVSFSFGPSKRFTTIVPDAALVTETRSWSLLKGRKRATMRILRRSLDGLDGVTPASLQAAWNHREEGGVHPFDVVDALGHSAEQLHMVLGDLDPDAVSDFVLERLADRAGHSPTRAQSRKLKRYAPWVLVGFLLAGWFNSQAGLGWEADPADAVAAR